MFYIYEWFIVETGEIFYVGKGTGKRYQVKKRNQIFNSYLSNYNCDVRIIRYFDDEEESFRYEERRIEELKKIGLAKANLNYGGNGGVASIWTKEMRARMSINNPMKAEEQKIRMSLFNPMKDPKVAEKVGKKHAKIVIYQDKEWYVKDLVPILNASVSSIQQYAKKGYTPKGELCYYKINGKSKEPFVNKSKKPIQVDDIIFGSVIEAANYLGIKPTTLSTYLSKKISRCKKHYISYANQQPSRENSDKSISEGSTTNE